MEHKEELYYYHNDINGAPLRLTDQQGKVVWNVHYDVMGRIDIPRLKVNEVHNPIRMQGQYEDEETGLYYNRYRYFDPNICAYASQDPLGLLAGSNTYSYPGNIFRMCDPLGLCENSVGSSGQKALPPPGGTNPWKDGTEIISYPAPKGGIEVNMAMGPGQVNPGGWTTKDNIPNVDYVRNELAVTPQFKDQITHVQKFIIPKGVQIQEGIVGEQLYNGILYPGGGNQVQVLNFSDRSKLIKVGEPIEIF